MMNKVLAFLIIYLVIIIECDGEIKRDPFAKESLQTSSAEISPEENLQFQPLLTYLITLHYAKVADLAAVLQNKSSGLLSERGSVAFDTRTNQLWIKDTAEQMSGINQFLRAVDIPSKQVLIEARIVNVDEESAEELGLKFGTISESSVNESDQLNMDMPLKIEDVGHFTVAVARLGDHTLLDLELSALEREGRAKIISSPQLMAANRQLASIESGQEIPYQEKTVSGDTSVAFKKAVLSLKFTPEITPENKILLNLTVNQDKVSPLTVEGVPAISTQQVQTQILVPNGQTIVLGGIYEQTNSKVVERIPFWGSIPGIGLLFTNKETRAERKELLVFVTPKIVG